MFFLAKATKPWLFNFTKRLVHRDSLYSEHVREASKLGPLSLLPLPSATCCDPLSPWQDFAALYYPCQVVWGLETSSMLSSTSSSESLMQGNINRGALLHPPPFQCHKAGILRILRVAMMIWHFDTARGPIHSKRWSSGNSEELQLHPWRLCPPKHPFTQVALQLIDHSPMMAKALVTWWHLNICGKSCYGELLWCWCLSGNDM